VSSLLYSVSTCLRIGSKFLCIRSTPTETQSINENDFECLARTGVNTSVTAITRDDRPSLDYFHLFRRRFHVQSRYLSADRQEAERTGLDCFVRPGQNSMPDFWVRPRAGGFDAIFARVWVGAGAPPPETGLWWCRAERLSSALSQWSAPVQIMTANDCGWHSGPWKPSFQFGEQASDRALIFFDGSYRTSDPGPFPFASLSAAVK
jgi:hypothetical protein